MALDGLMEKRGGLWFGWSGSISDGPTAALAKVESAGGIDYATIDLTQDEHDRYYNNFSNGVLWPLLHTMPELMKFDRRDARVYQEVNTRIAVSLQPLLRPDDMIWVHDYHLLLLPAALRARGVKNPIGFFLHVPFASPDVLGAAPQVALLVRDLLAADLIGFQTDNDLANFAAAAQQLAGAVRVSSTVLMVAGRRVKLGVFPVEIEPQSFAHMAEEMERSDLCERLRRSLQGQQLILGIDRLDPTKGLMQRLAGYRRLIEKRDDLRRQVTLLQIAAESRKDVGSYRTLRAALDHEAGSLNADLGEPDWVPLRLISKATVRPAVAGYMRIARVGLVTPLRDGMNLVAKEYVAAQNPQDPRRAGAVALHRRRPPAGGGAAGQSARSRRHGGRAGCGAADGPERTTGPVAGTVGDDRAPFAGGVGAVVRGQPAAGDRAGGTAYSASPDRAANRAAAFAAADAGGVGEYGGGSSAA